MPLCSSAPSLDPAFLEFIARSGERLARTLAEFLIDSEEDRALPAVLVGMLQEGDRLRS